MAEPPLTQEYLTWAQAWAAEHVTLLVAVLLALLFVQSARLALIRGLAARRVAKSRRLGADGERRARALLKKNGYRLVGEQEGGTYEIFMDGAATPVHLRADFVVTKKGKRYVAEVKSGVESVKVTGRNTRRQLLEYLFAFEVDGVLLVDMQVEKIRRVEFPPLRGR